MNMFNKGYRSGLIGILFIILALNLLGAYKAWAANVTFRYIAVNPSATKTQTVPIKKYLPEEVTPKDIIDSGGLDIEYDENVSLYYAYSEGVELAPKEIRTFEVEVSDIWIVPESELSELANRTDAVLAHLDGTEFYEKAREISDTIYPRLEDIRKAQLDDTISRPQHIGIYRNNLITVGEIKEDIARMEKILVTAGGPPAPEMLAKAKIKSEAPTKTMTWIVIFVIITFLGLLGGVMFFTWHHQARVTKEALAESKKAAFPGPEEEKEPKE